MQSGESAPGADTADGLFSCSKTLRGGIVDGVAKSPPYGVTAFFTSTYLLYAFAPEKPHELFA
jgi:hypothetical protein